MFIMSSLKTVDSFLDVCFVIWNLLKFIRSDVAPLVVCSIPITASREVKVQVITGQRGITPRELNLWIVY